MVQHVSGPAPKVAPPSPPMPKVSTGRYAPARPASIFAVGKRDGVFAAEVSDKSLDEVILSYLAEDLEPPKKR